MHFASDAAPLERAVPPRDTTIASVLRDLNATTLRAVIWAGPVAAAMFVAVALVTRRLVFLAFAAVAIGLMVSSSQRLRRGNHDVGFLVGSTGVLAFAMWPLASGLTRGGLAAALLLLAMIGFLVLPPRSRHTTAILFAGLVCAQVLWPTVGEGSPTEVIGHVGVSLVYLLVALLATGAVRSALERSERTRLEVFRRVPVGLIRVSRSGTLIEANQAFADMFGYEAPELIGQPVAMLYEDAAPLMQLANQMGVTTEPQRYAHRLQHRNGRTLWVRGYVQPVRDELGTILHYEGAVEDVTQRREIEEKSRVHAERFRNVFERAPIAIWEEDWSGVATELERIRSQGVTDVVAYLQANPDEFLRLYEAVVYLDVNPAGMELVAARTKEEAFANTRPPPPPSPIADSFIHEFAAIWDDLDHMTLEASGHRVDGAPLDLSISWAAARDDEGRLDLSHVIVAMMDITTVKRAERELEALIVSKDELVASVSHELRTPITTIMGMAFELRDNAASFTSDEVFDLIGIVADQSRELSNIVDDLLVAARSDLETLAVRAEHLDLRDEIEQIIASSSADLSPDTQVEAGTSAWADPLRFRQIVRNLLSNAHRYGGPSVTIRAWSDAHEVVLTVHDDGDGVPAGDEETIFEPYVRTKRDAALPGSIGLGLPVSRRLARLMGGDLTYRYDGGAVFELRLPSAEARVVAV